MRSKTCFTCKEYKKLDDFYKNRCLKDGYLGVCKNCDKNRRKQWRKTNHGRLWRTWEGMKARCYCRTHTRYSDYGGRSITICEEWLNFNTFYQWAINNNWSSNLEIDRINNDGNYEPQNCRFITTKENTRNRRTTILNQIKVRIIKRCLELKMKQKDVAKIFSIIQNHVSRIKTGKRWA